ncbi:AI-2E family transporter [Natrinema saccharevitans]|uniref:AI-2E family transporter n=1 Tax=Natrinema saccharevitans TaxID=301967 RepID=A0A1S8AVW3_9EURY|nr:AI-2E family transporter [Natrinema saccharevitans]OLZ40524.1 AI-2E family transporter [Natrinema saccharevitans]
MDARTSFFALLVSILAGVAALLVRPLLEYVLGACLLAVVLRPAYERLAPRFGDRVAALALTALVIVAGLVPLVLVSLVVVRTAASTLENVSVEGLTAYGGEVARTELGIERESVAVVESELQTRVQEAVASVVDVTFERSVWLLSTAVDVAIGTVVFAFLLYYLLVDGAALLAWLRRIVPLESAVVDELFAEVHAVTWAVLRSHVLVAVLQGALGGIGLALLGVPSATVLAVVLLFASFLPTVGVWLVWGPVTVAHAAADGPASAAVLLGYGIVVLAVADYYLRSILVDRRSGLHPALALLGVIGGISLFGVVGLFVGPVILGAFVAALRVANRRLEPVSTESGTEIERESPVVETER